MIAAGAGGLAVPARRPALPLLAALGVLLAIIVPLALGRGAVVIAPRDIGAILAARVGLDAGSTAFTARQEAVLLAIRLPRVLLGLLVGGALGAGGAAVQALFRNPLADPALIGTAGGAALAAAATIVLAPYAPIAAPPWLLTALLPLAAFVGAAATTALVYRLSRRDGHTAVATLLLAGIAINALVGAATGLLTFVASDAQLRSLTFWSLGSLGGATWLVVAATSPFLVASIAVLPRAAAALNLLLLGERDAEQLGVDVERLKRRVVLVVALGVGAAVATCGVIGFIGLVVPHVVRLAAGPDHHVVLPGSVLLGAALLVGADLLARTVVMPAELPIGIVTALAGAPVFLWLLRRAAARWV